MGQILDDIQAAVLALKRQKLKELCDQLKPEQLDLFNKAFGNIELLPERTLNTAIDLVERTIIGNQKKGKDA